MKLKRIAMLVVLLLSSAPFAGSQEARRRVPNVEVLDLDGNPAMLPQCFPDSAFHLKIGGLGLPPCLDFLNELEMEFSYWCLQDN